MNSKRALYIAGPMQGIKDFNFPAFHEAAAVWRYRGWVVFSPAERDEQKYGEDICKSEMGSMADAIAKGFSLREALAEDMLWLATHAEAIFMMRGWENSKGAQAEWALARALGLEIFYQD